MNTVRGLVIGSVFLVGLGLVRPTASFAHGAHAKADLKLLRDAASALAQSRPDLAQGLNAYANREASEMDERAREAHEKEETGEQVEPRDEQHEQIRH